jgi:hypothetical protein
VTTPTEQLIIPVPAPFCGDGKDTPAQLAQQMRAYSERNGASFEKTRVKVQDIDVNITNLGDRVDDLESGGGAGVPTVTYQEWIRVTQSDEVTIFAGDQRMRVFRITAFGYDGNVAAAQANDWSIDLEGDVFGNVGPTRASGGVFDITITTVAVGANAWRLDYDKTTYELKLSTNYITEFQIFLMIEAFEQYTTNSVTI